MKILGPSLVTLEEARSWATAKGAHQRFIAVAWHYWDKAPRYGIPAELAYCQAAHETNWGKFTGVVPSTYHNWCGLKTEQGGSNTSAAAHQTFENDSDGVLAHLQHLARYAGAQSPPVSDPLLDPRWHLVTKFTDTVEGLGGEDSWAPRAGYGADLVELTEALIAFAQNWEPPMGTPYDHIIPGMIDARSQLATANQNQGGVPRGPYERIPLSAKRGVVVHYRGVVTDVNAGLASFKSDATYHVGKNWARAGEAPILGSGIMYHIGIDGEGNVYLLRDLDRVLWHCGAWPQNENTLAIQLPLGGNQRATNKQLMALSEVVDHWLAFTKAPDTEVWGHQELSPTDCPGTLMTDFVKPYRNAPATPPSQFFNETGHTVGGGFLQFWKKHGGIQIFGYPLTEEVKADGMTIQWFERARFEHRPDIGNPDDWHVVLGLLGREALNRGVT